MEWKELQTLVKRKIGYGIVQPGASVPNGVPVIKVNNIIAGLTDINQLDTTSKEIDDKYPRTKLHGGELVVSVVGTFGKTAIIPKTFAGCNLVRATCLIDIEDPILCQWVKYYIDSPKGQAYINSNLNTTVQATLNVKDLCSMPIPFYSKGYQDKAVSILSSLDRKIELNNQINKQLEEMAQAIFKSWFIDFEPFKDGEFVDSELGRIPKGWRVGKITDLDILITDYVSNGSFASLKENVKLYETLEYAQFIRNTDLKNGSFSVFVDKHSYEFLSKSKLFGDEIIISNVGDVGSVYLCPKLSLPMTLGNNVIMLRPDDKNYTYFLYLWYKYFAGQALMQGIKGGSAQPKFNKTDFKNLPILLPNKTTIDITYRLFRSIFAICERNKFESLDLSTLRDTLLPKLMSGEINLEQYGNQ